MNEKHLIISCLQIHTPEKILTQACVVIKNRKIHAIVPMDQISQYQPYEILEFPEHFHLIPGFIDLHIHGANGSDVMDASRDALMNICETLAKEGTTSFLATTMTASTEDIEKALVAVRDFIKDPQIVSGATLLGVHLEGPFLSPNKVGAQRADQILVPKIDYIQHWQTVADQVIKLVTLAPELPNSLEMIRYLQQNNIVAAMGHTEATFSQAMNAITTGCTHATHLFNAMRGIHQREPGPALAALLSDQVMVELILDGVHLHPAMVQMTLKLKGKTKIVLVTDAMRAKCMPDGVYDLGGQRVAVKDNIAQLADGTLAGSVLKMDAAFRHLLEFTSCSMSDAIQMTAENPAKALGIFPQKGSIAVGKDADLVVLDDKLKVMLTVCEGRLN